VALGGSRRPPLSCHESIWGTVNGSKISGWVIDRVRTCDDQGQSGRCFNGQHGSLFNTPSKTTSPKPTMIAIAPMTMPTTAAAGFLDSSRSARDRELNPVTTAAMPKKIPTRITEVSRPTTPRMMETTANRFAGREAAMLTDHREVGPPNNASSLAAAFGPLL
jgi:hypothetical protein